MRGAIALLTLAALLLAGCSTNDALDATGAAPSDARGAGFADIASAEWKPGYHFEYEDRGAFHATYSGDGEDGPESGSESESFGPSPSLNYTVANVLAKSREGKPVYLAVQHPEHASLGESPEILGFDPVTLGLSYVSLGMQQSCAGSNGDCVATAVVYVYGDDDEGPAPLTFPLVDGKTSTSRPEYTEPPMFLSPVEVETKVLGMKKVAGPQGDVDAVHVHHELTVDFAEVAKRVNEEAAEDGVTDFQVDGKITGSRDVFYAPSLHNIVLDRSISGGHYEGSYVRDGKRASFSLEFGYDAAHQLTKASLKETPATPVDQLAAIEDGLPFGIAIQPQALGSGSMRIDISNERPNIADGETLKLSVARGLELAEATVSLELHDASGVAVATTKGTALDFKPEQPGYYIASARATDANGTLLAVAKGLILASYSDVIQVACPPLTLGGVNACPSAKVPMGVGVDRVYLYADIADPVSAAALPADLRLDMGSQSITAPRTGDYAVIDLPDAGRGWTGEEWSVVYEPMAGAAVGVDYYVTVTPSFADSFQAYYATGGGSAGQARSLGLMPVEARAALGPLLS